MSRYYKDTPIRDTDQAFALDNERKGDDVHTQCDRLSGFGTVPRRILISVLLVGLFLTISIIRPVWSQAVDTHYATSTPHDVSEDLLSVSQERPSDKFVPLSSAVDDFPSLTRSIDLNIRDATLEEALQTIAAHAGVQISYASTAVDTPTPITLVRDNISVYDAFQALLASTNFDIVVSPTGYLVLTEKGQEMITEYEIERPKKGIRTPQLSPIPPSEQVDVEIQQTVSGTVTNVQTGASLPGVNIRVVGTNVGTSTDGNGRYSLDVPSESDTLQFSYVGFEVQRIPVNGRSTIDVSLQPTTLTGGEVVVTGYSSQQRLDLTGSVDVVDVADMQTIAESQITDQLQGMASGLNVISSGQPGEDPQIRIRGINTFGNNTPLFIVDGVPTQNVGNFDASNVESVQVLKDASAASIYGSRAANGVVIIETRQGEGDMRVQVNSYTGFSMQPNETNPWDLLMPQGRADLEWRAHQNSGVVPSDPQYGDGGEPRLPDYVLPSGAMEGDSGIDPSLYQLDPFFSDPAEAEDFYQIVRASKQGTDWFNEIMRTGAVTNTNVTVSGGSDQGSYLFSGNYLSEEGTLKRTYLERYSLRVNTSYNVGEHVRIGENISYTTEENMLANTVGDQAITESFRMRPLVPVRDIAGNWAGVAGDGLGNGANPVAIRERTRNDKTLDKRLFGNTFVEVEFLSDFRFRTLFGGSVNSGYFYDFTFPRYERGTLTSNSLSENAWNNHDLTLSNTLHYSNTFSQDHNVTILTGVEWTKNTTRTQSGSVTRFFSFNPDFVNLSTGSGSNTIGSSVTETSIVSQFGKVDYNYARRYFLSATLRRDGSSKFLENRYGFFPAGSIGWRISEEAFMDGWIPWLTDLKLRAGWGVMGNQLNVDPNNAYTLFGANPYAYSNTGDNATAQQGFSPSQIGAPAAKWERNENLNIGVDIALFDGQLEAVVDYYRKDIEDLLFNPERPGTAGQADAPFINVAGMVNTGVDASVRGETELGGFQLGGSVNFTSYNNEITRIAEGFGSFSEESRRFAGQNIIRNEVGQEMSSYYGYRIEGFWQNQQEITQANDQAPDGQYQPGAAPGRFRYKDTNGDGQITAEDRTFLGSPNPDFTYGINLNFGYSNWDLSMSLFGSQGAELWNNVKWFTDFFSSFNGAKSRVALNDSWTPDNRDAEAPIQELSQSFSTNQVPNSYFVEDGSFLRIQNIQLGYTLPSKWIQSIGIEDLKVYVQASNIYTFTGYSNPDPEVGGSDPTDVTSFGVDQGRYATPRKILGGINLTF